MLAGAQGHDFQVLAEPMSQDREREHMMAAGANVSRANGLHCKASQGDKVCAMFMHHLNSEDKAYLHWGKVLAVEGSECTIK